MKNLFRNWAVRGLLIGSLIAAPWVALAALNQVQNDNGSTGFLSNVAASGIQALTFFDSGRVVRTSSVNGTGLETWAFDEKTYTIAIADLGTLSDGVIVIDESGVIMEVSIAWNKTLTGANAVLTFFRVAKGGDFNGPTTLSAISLAPATTSVGGAMLTDDTIFQTVGRGDVIAVQTDGGPTNAVPAQVTIRIRAPRLN